MMSILPIPSLQSLVTKVVKATAPNVPDIHDAPKLSTKRAHVIHYVLKGLGKLPTPILERLNIYLRAPTAAQYPHADAHLRLIFGLNCRFKPQIQLTQLIPLRQKFARDMVSMQSPKVWQQANNDDSVKNIYVKNSCFRKNCVTHKASKNQNNNNSNNKNRYPVSWQDKTIANADDGDMRVRCYQARGNDDGGHHALSAHHNPDKVVMLFLHGGGFCLGDVDTHHEFCHRICAKTGWALVSIDYRLAPEHPAPKALQDCLAAYVWLTEHAHELDGVPSRIVLAGDSAGGCLAALTAQQVTVPTDIHWQGMCKDDSADDKFIAMLQDLPPPLAQLALYPVTDINTNYPSWELYSKGLLLSHNDVEVFNAAFLQHSTLSHCHPLISPIHADNTQMCPSYIVAAELDILRDEGLAYAQQLQDYGIKTKVDTALGAPHGFINLMSVHSELGHKTDHIINEFADFVRSLLSTT